ncbi:MAG: hypothetical protein RLZZ200_2813 [Pseudomonadota bacterium]|jgi:hypothetical protein
MFPRLLVVLVLICSPASAVIAAEKQLFDLAGPGIDATVTRGDEVLPLSKIPGLAAGDRLHIRPVLPQGDAAKYLMVAAFLRGSTNPPPDDWFRRCDTWRKSCLEKGLDLVVPRDAVQLVLLFAPKTGGDYKTLVRTVQGRPGAFVRASQELFQFSLDRLRLERYVAELSEVGAASPGRVKEVAPLLARSLGIKVDEKCFDRLPALQLPCLTQAENSMVLADGHDPTLMSTLASGPASDLAMQVGNTRVLNSGAYVPYIGSLLSLARLMDNFQSARYQYIPALMHPEGSRITLMLNTPPSFHEPQSVLVTAFPPIGEARLPALRNPDPGRAVCVYDKPAVLPLAGGSLLFGASFAQSLVLRVEPAGGADRRDIGLSMDRQAGGFRLGDVGAEALVFAADRPAALQGRWGFDALEGPTYQLGPQALDAVWQVAPDDVSSLVIGRESVVHLSGGDASCLKGLRVFDGAEQSVPATWSIDAAGQLLVRIDLRGALGGGLKLEFDYVGPQPRQTLALRSFIDAGKLDGFDLHVGETTGTLRGSRLDLVKALRIGNAVFEPKPGHVPPASESLPLSLRAGENPPEGNVGTPLRASIELRDGRTVALVTRLLASRPRSSLVSVSVEEAETTDAVPLKLVGSGVMRPEGTLTFSVRLEASARFGPKDAIEVATDDGLARTMLTPGNGLVLSNAQVAIAMLKPAAQLGPTAFGPIMFRVVTAGQQGEWQRLGTLVRTPALSRLGCASDGQGRCELEGERLYLVQAIADTATFRQAVDVPEGFTARRLSVPHPKGGKLYLKLRDDPDVVAELKYGEEQP